MFAQLNKAVLTTTSHDDLYYVSMGIFLFVLTTGGDESTKQTLLGVLVSTAIIFLSGCLYRKVVKWVMTRRKK